MFTKLFAESGLSLDRLRALLEVGAAGSIVKAADSDPVRQSQYSRQIKEVEDFFHTKLVERHGKGTRLTSRGKELARISRFLLGLSNFQRGCLAEAQTFRIGACATFIHQFLLPGLSGSALQQDRTSYVTETLTDGEIEHRLHDLTLDFGIVTSPTISRPLQTKPLGEWHLELWAPKALRLSEARAARAFEEQRLPLVLAKKELTGTGIALPKEYEALLSCDSFLDAKTALDRQRIAAFLPSFLAPKKSQPFLRVRLPTIDSHALSFYLAWNPRLLRLNPHATRRRDLLAEALLSQMAR